LLEIRELSKINGVRSKKQITLKEPYLTTLEAIRGWKKKNILKAINI
jgi:hypothetical protein